jgi:hypothetical protein
MSASADVWGFWTPGIDTTGHTSLRRLKKLSIHTNRATKRSFAAVIAAALIASVLALVASPASAGTTVTLKRYSGIDRYATSALAATGAFTTGGDNVVLVSGENFADGLAAAAQLDNTAVTTKGTRTAGAGALIGKTLGTAACEVVVAMSVALTAGRFELVVKYQYN